MVHKATTLESTGAHAEYTALGIYCAPSLGYGPSFTTSIANIGRLRAENNCRKQTDSTQIYI